MHRSSRLEEGTWTGFFMANRLTHGFCEEKSLDLGFKTTWIEKRHHQPYSKPILGFNNLQLFLKDQGSLGKFLHLCITSASSAAVLQRCFSLP